MNIIPMLQSSLMYAAFTFILLVFFLTLQSEEHYSDKCLTWLGETQNTYTYPYAISASQMKYRNIPEEQNIIRKQNTATANFFVIVDMGGKKPQHWSNSTWCDIPVWLASCAHPYRTVTSYLHSSLCSFSQCAVQLFLLWRMILPSASSVHSSH